MLYINKEAPSPEVSQEISRVERDVQWKKTEQPDTLYARLAFNQLNKGIIRKQLIREQHGLCAYCMRRIYDNDSTVIEHRIPVNRDPRATLNYNNMMACCDGGRKSDSTPRVLCCDASKGNKEISISPYNRDQMETIRYDKNGRIYIYPRDEELEYDLNQVLYLNGEAAGSVILQDTSTGLIYGRKQTYRSFEVFIKGLNKKGKPVGAAIRRKIDEISNSEEYIEFAGVWLYFLKRKLR